MKLDGGWTISQALFEAMLLLAPPEEQPRLLEFGSGAGSPVLAQAGYTVVSIEHDPNWLNYYKGIYVHAPLVDRWYDRKIVLDTLKNYTRFDVWLIDGPPGSISNREKIIEIIDLDKLPYTIVVDDTQREDGKLVAQSIANLLESNGYIFLTEKVISNEAAIKEAVIYYNILKNEV